MILERTLRYSPVLLFSLVAAACGSGATGEGATTSASAGSGGGAPGTSGGDTGPTGGPTGGPSGSGSSSGGGGGAAAPVCPPPFGLVDTSKPTTKVGSGAGTCTEKALADAVHAGGIITFDCGGAATILLHAPLNPPIDKDTTIDGAGLITLDGGGKTRLVQFNGVDFRKNKSILTLQRLTFTGARSTGTSIPPAPPPCSQGFDVDGGGAAVLIRDGILHVIDVTFSGGAAASPGPDVAGGGVYAIGSIDVTITQSRFKDNTASNGGAVGSLFSNLTLVDDVFDHNQATGTGANTIDPKCMVRDGESGDGGNGGAVSIDGGEDFTVQVCGCTFTGNHANALGGALFRTPDGPRAAVIVDKSTFDGNQATGGGVLYLHHTDLTLTASTLSNNTAEGAGAIQADDTTLTITNATFAGNRATKGLGGAIALFGNGGKLRNVTFANNHADGGSGLFGAAIAGGTTLTIDNSLFANNTSMDCGAPMACQVGKSAGVGDVQWPEKHLVCANADPPCASGGTTFADPGLSELGENGGPTRTLVPKKGGPAAGVGVGCPEVDQRGVARKKPDGCTAGAVEIQ